MKAYYISPEDIGVGGYWSDKWIAFCKALGYTDDNIPKVVLVAPIDTIE